MDWKEGMPCVFQIGGTGSVPLAGGLAVRTIPYPNTSVLARTNPKFMNENSKRPPKTGAVE